MTDFDEASIAVATQYSAGLRWMYVKFKDNFIWMHMFTFVGHYGIVWCIWIETNTAYENFNTSHVPLFIYRGVAV